MNHSNHNDNDDDDDPTGKGNYLGRSLRRFDDERKGCTYWKCLGYLIPFTILLGCSGGLIYFTGNASKLKNLTDDALKKLIPKLSPEDLEDPFAGDASDVPKWDNRGGSGLELDFLNALEPKWQVPYTLAMADWDFGNPDSLSLSSEQVDYEFECAPVEGKVKVCNGNYGDVKWRGINSAVVDGNNYITQSSAKMNEFYLENDVDGARQYTMCHELGHALGLPHSDEDFENADLGNCMDYTNNFDANKHPDEMNYEFLLDLYGATGLRRERHLQRRRHPFLKLPETIRRTMREAVSKLEQRIDDKAHEDGWRLLHRTKHGEAHEMELGEGYKVRVHMLLA
jgi:hypothetical protein